MELMRGLAFIALLFAGSAVGAELRQAEVCGDGTTHQFGYCPAVLSSASCSATGATTGSCSATSDETDGTRYVCATSSVAALTGAEIEACSGGAAIAGSSAAETGSNSVSLSGLTTDAAHYGQIVNESPEGWYSNRLVSSSFTPSGSVQTNAQRISAVLAGRSPHFVYSTPSDPVTTSTCNAATAAQFNACSAVDGTEITVTGSFSGNITITGNDIDILMDNGYTITGSLTIGTGGSRATRIRWTGGNHVGQFIGVNFQDALFDDWYSATPTSSDWTAAVEQLLRVAVINSTLEYTGGGTGASYHVYIGPVDNVIPVPSTFHQDLIFANTKIIGNGGHTARIMGVQRLLMVDTVWNPDGASAFAGLRFHYSCSDIWARDTWVRDGFKIDAVNASDPGPSFTNALFDNFDRYADDAYSIGLWAFNGSGGSWVNSNTGTVQNSTLYNSAGSGTVGFTGYTNGGGNSNSTWNGSTVPDYSGVGAVR